MSLLNVDKIDPNSGTALEIGTSGDTVTVPSGVGLTLTNSTLLLPTTITSTTEVKTNKISPATGVAFALGDSGDTFTVPSGATIDNLGTATGFGGGKIVQVVNVMDGAYASGTTVMETTTIPQNTEGDEYMTLAITPTSATNKLLINVTVNIGASTTVLVCTALFQDSTANAIGGAMMGIGRGDVANVLTYSHYMTSGTTSATTFKVRCGTPSGAGAGTCSFNGGSSTGLFFGGVMSSSITIMEIEV